MLPVCRLIVDPLPRSGTKNMACDEALLDSVIHGGLPTLRWYQWREPTLSLGYFQESAEVEREPRWAGLAKVRRLTGGGAILHDLEWTYSCVLPAHQSLVRHPYDLYDIIHQGVIDWLARLGIPLHLRGKTRHAQQEPLLCFLREDSHDVCWQGTKVLGSAQRRRKGALLQHGSLVLRRSALAPELAGLCDLAGRSDFLDDRAGLAQSVAGQLAHEIERGELTAEELTAMNRLVDERYSRIDQR